MKVKLFCDGGSRGNPGESGCGSVIFAADSNEILAKNFTYLNVSTNNYAEYQGLLIGLQLAKNIGAEHISVYSDSNLLVNQMTGKWKIKHETIKVLAKKVRDLQQDFSHVDYVWIPREENMYADKLANQAMDNKTSQTEIY